MYVDICKRNLGELIEENPKTIVYKACESAIQPLSIKFFNDLIYNYPMCCTAVGEKRVPDEYGIIEFDMLEFPNRGTGVPTLTDYVREYDEN